MSLREWFTAAELAAFSLPGMPATKAGMLALIERQGWQRQPREARGGGFEYHRINLPLAARLKLDRIMARELLAEPANTNAPGAIVADRTSADMRAEGTGRTPDPSAPMDPRRESLWRTFDRKPAKTKGEAERRLKILQAVESLIADGRPKVKAIDTMAEAAGEHAATIRRWRATVRGIDKADWLPALAPGHVGRVATVECSPEAWDFFTADYLRNARPSAESCYERLMRVAAERGWTVPSLKTLKRRLEAQIPAAAIVLSRDGAEAAGRMYPAQERDRSVFKALEAVVADGHKFDVFVLWEDGTIGRPIVVGFQDLFSGKMLAHRVGQVESADLVRLALGDLIEAHGIPDKVWLDNGRAFASKMISGGTANRYRFKVKPEDPAGVLTLLSIGIHWTRPYHGQSKPIERAWRDWADRVSKHPAFEGAYTGNKPDAKPENYGSKAVPIATFLAVLAEEVKWHNARQGRESAVCAGRSFDDVFAESYATALVRKASAEQRRLFLLAAEGVTANREDGSVRLLGNRYWAADEGLMRAAGSKIVVRFDPDHLGHPIHAYTTDGRFIATLDQIEKVAFDSADDAKAHARNVSIHLRNTKAAAASARRLSTAEIAAMLPGAPTPDQPSSPVVRGVFKQALKPRRGVMSREDRDAAFGEFVDQARAGKGIA